MWDECLAVRVASERVSEGDCPKAELMRCGPMIMYISFFSFLVMDVEKSGLLNLAFKRGGGGDGLAVTVRARECV